MSGSFEPPKYSREGIYMVKLCTLGILTVALLVACGDDVTRFVAGEPQGLEVAADVDSLPACNAKNIGGLFLIPKSEEVYVCLDSGWKSLTPEAKGHSCMTVMLPDSSASKIVCDGDSLGVVFNGRNGLSGETGDAGEDGADDETCRSVDNGDGSFWQICGEDSVMLYKAFCRDTPYDPDSAFCDSRDMLLYRTVQIGEQVWMAENLNHFEFFCPSEFHCAAAEYDSDMKTRIGTCYEEKSENCEKLGRLYTIQHIERLCPDGWHMPDSTEWNTLFAFVEKTGGENVVLSLRATEGWQVFPGSRFGLDLFGFGALPGGFMVEIGTDYTLYRNFYKASYEAYFLSAEGGSFFFDGLDPSADPRYEAIEGFAKGVSVRCVRDDG